MSPSSPDNYHQEAVI